MRRNGSHANAKGQTTAFPTAVGALEAASGLVSRAFATAVVETDCAALYVQGQVWNRQQDGFINLYVHKDRQGDLPAQLGECAATIISVHHGPLIDAAIGLPNAKAAKEDLTDE